MQTDLRQEKARQVGVFALVSGLVILADQLSKTWVLNSLTHSADQSVARAVPSRIVPVIPAVLRFRFARNSGAAFSIFENHPEILTAIAACMSVVVLVWALKFLRPEERLGRVAMAVVFGGAVGNLIDRIRYDFFVVDFIEIHWQGRPLWPTFNVADSAICVGVGLFLVSSLFLLRADARAASGEAES